MAARQGLPVSELIRRAMQLHPDWSTTAGLQPDSTLLLADIARPDSYTRDAAIAEFDWNDSSDRGLTPAHRCHLCGAAANVKLPVVIAGETTCGQQIPSVRWHGQ